MIRIDTKWTEDEWRLVIEKKKRDIKYLQRLCVCVFLVFWNFVSHLFRCAAAAWAHTFCFHSWISAASSWLDYKTKERTVKLLLEFHTPAIWIEMRVFTCMSLPFHIDCMLSEFHVIIGADLLLSTISFLLCSRLEPTKLYHTRLMCVWCVEMNSQIVAKSRENRVVPKKPTEAKNFLELQLSRGTPVTANGNELAFLSAIKCFSPSNKRLRN